MYHLCWVVMIIILVIANTHFHCGDKFTIISFARAFTEPLSIQPSESFGHR